MVLDELGFSVFWHNATSGVHGVDLLLLDPDESVLALEGRERFVPPRSRV